MKKHELNIATFQYIIQNNIKNIIKLNNRYRDLGYIIYLENNYLSVNINNFNYKISIVQKDNFNYWHLVPYDNTFFETRIDSFISSLDMVLFAIHDNEVIHRKRGRDGK